MEFSGYMFGLGCVGGLIPDVVRVIKNRYNKGLPSYFGEKSFWIGFCALIIFGGFVAWLAQATDEKTALSMGFLGPEVVSNLLGKKGSDITPETIRGLEEKKFRLRTWWGS